MLSWHLAGQSAVMVGLSWVTKHGSSMVVAERRTLQPLLGRPGGVCMSASRKAASWLYMLEMGCK